jgi:transposase
MGKSQLHKRLSDEQAKFILGKYLSGEIRAKSAIEKLGLGRTRFYQVAAAYESDPASFSIGYQRRKTTRQIDPAVERNILAELAFEKEHIIDRPDVPTRRYNYSYIKKLLKEKYDQDVSLDAIIARAKDHGFHLGKPPKAAHDREVVSEFAGELVQHDSSHHLFAPDAGEKWYLVTSLDDFSRKILYGDLWTEESSFAGSGRLP